MIKIDKKSDCCGCAACYNTCPSEAISMQYDIEGFEYPVVDQNKCINCGKCIKVCRDTSRIKINTENTAYLFQQKNPDIQKESTSGGVFTAIASYVIEHQGVVFGASFVNNKVMHISAQNVEDLKKFRNSKYVQSSIGTVYKEVKGFLKEGRMVLFSGTGCQVAGLYRYLGCRNENLITVDVVCRAVPSPVAFGKYISYMEDKMSSKIEEVRFRDKYYGYMYSTMYLRFSDNTIKYHRGIESDPWLRAFFSGVCNRPSCYECAYKGIDRVSDFTIWDCFSLWKYNESSFNNMGTTRVLVHNNKNKDIIDYIGERGILSEEPVEKLVEGVVELRESCNKTDNREDFFKDMQLLSSKDLYDKWFPINYRAKVKHIIRVLLIKTRIYMCAKRFVWLIKKKS